VPLAILVWACQSAPQVILTIVPSENEDLSEAAIAASVIYGAGFTLPFRESCTNQASGHRPAANKRGIEVQCDIVTCPFVRAAFLALGFGVIEPMRLARYPRKTNLVTCFIAAGHNERYWDGGEKEFTIGAIALRAAGVLEAFTSPNGPNIRDNEQPSTRFELLCDSSDLSKVTNGFAAIGFRVQTNSKSN